MALASIRKYSIELDPATRLLGKGKGNSDQDTRWLLRTLLDISQETYTTNAELYCILSELLLDNLDFTSVYSGTTVQTRLPNTIYRKLLVYLIIHLADYSAKEQVKLRQILTSMEEHAITGITHVSIHGRSAPTIRDRLSKYGTHYEIEQYIDPLGGKCKKIDRGIALSNSLAVMVISDSLRMCST